MIPLLSSKGYAGNYNTSGDFLSSKKNPQSRAMRQWIKGKERLSIYLLSGQLVVASIERQNPWQLSLRDWQGKELILFKHTIAWITPNRERDKSVSITSVLYGKELLPEVMAYEGGPTEKTPDPPIPQEGKPPSVQIIKKKRRRIDPNEIPKS